MTTTDWPFHPLKPHSYDVVYSDCPWPMWGDPNKDQAAGKHYDLMSKEELAALPVRDLLDGHGVVLVWATCPRLDVAIDTLRAWGLHYRGIAYVWVKTSRAGNIISGQGVRPTTVKPTTELVLVGSIRARGRPLPLMTEGQGQVVLAPRGRHSQKPAEVRRRIEELFGAEVRRAELFARERAPGWDGWGAEFPAASGWYSTGLGDVEDDHSGGFIAKCDHVLRMLDSILDPPDEEYLAPWAALEFAESVLPKVRGMRGNAITGGQVTSRMRKAIENIGRGARNWCVPQRQYCDDELDFNVDAWGD